MLSASRKELPQGLKPNIHRTGYGTDKSVP